MLVSSVPDVIRTPPPDVMTVDSCREPGGQSDDDDHETTFKEEQPYGAATKQQLAAICARSPPPVLELLTRGSIGYSSRDVRHRSPATSTPFRADENEVTLNGA
jgi:hypothetical protein